MRSRPWKTAAIFSVAAVAFAACSSSEPATGDDSESADTQNTEPTTAAPTTVTPTTDAPTTTTTTAGEPQPFPITVADFELLFSVQEAVLVETFTPRVEDPELQAIVSSPEASVWVATSPSGGGEQVAYTALYSPTVETVPTQQLGAIGSQLYDLDSGAIVAFSNDILPQLESLSGSDVFSAEGWYDLGVFSVDSPDGVELGLLFVFVPERAPISAALIDELSAAALAHQDVETSRIGLGINLIPDDVAPGVYRTIVDPDGSCLVRRLSSPIGGDDDVLAQVSWEEDSQAIINIPVTDVAFDNAANCGRWQAIGIDVEPLRPEELVPTGTLMVGIDVQVGTYRTVVPPGGFCLVQRLAGFTGTPVEVISQQAFDEGETAFIEIAATDAGFANVAGCGTWEPV